ncbi:MAG: tyrosine-type recombinase/integrase [Bacteriovoracaceae bacterium]|jgi:site-specific recombinase XerD|nr:tyrosine-type recombinase/integrase [Bacteriovoracaceae bacterium]
MLDDHLKSEVTRKRLRDGLAAPYIDEFADWLYKQGFKPIVLEQKLRYLAIFMDWLQEHGFNITSIVEGTSACKKSVAKGRKLYSRGVNKLSIVNASKFIVFLQEQDVLVRPKPNLKPHEQWPLLGEFRSWSILNKGIKETTLDLYETCLRDFVRVLGSEPEKYSAKLIRKFVIDRSKGHSKGRAQAIGVAIRSFLRFLLATGRCKESLISAVPTHSNPRLQSAPRYLTDSELKKVEKSCNGKDENGLRDKAIILLLTRLALRASDVANLTFDDIDWQNGRIRISGKSRRQEWLPLPQEVGDAILDYLTNGRSKLEFKEIFIRVDAPIQPLKRASVTHVVRSAFVRAGVKAKVNGAHTLRHSAATAMLDKGVSLAGIGAVLRHRSFDTTGMYAKVDFNLLKEVQQPWPGVKLC